MDLCFAYRSDRLLVAREPVIYSVDTGMLGHSSRDSSQPGPETEQREAGHPM